MPRSLNGFTMMLTGEGKFSNSIPVLSSVKDFGRPNFVIPFHIEFVLMLQNQYSVHINVLPSQSFKNTRLYASPTLLTDVTFLDAFI
jgi:hypothetical protein